MIFFLRMLTCAWEAFASFFAASVLAARAHITQHIALPKYVCPHHALPLPFFLAFPHPALLPPSSSCNPALRTQKRASAALQIQRVWRGHRVRVHTPSLARVRAAVVRLQSLVRARIARREAARLKRERDDRMATRIQARTRGAASEGCVFSLLPNCMVLQQCGARTIAQTYALRDRSQ